MQTSPFHRPLISHPGLQMAMCTFAILVLEIALIRWVGTQIRFAAYVSNLVLIAAFLGMGLGVALGRRRPGLFAWSLPTLALVVGLLSLAEPLGFVRIGFADASVSQWGADYVGSAWQVLKSASVVMAAFLSLVGIFLLCGVPVGWLFDRMVPLTAYRWDLMGSLCGVLAMALMAYLSLPPVVWFVLGILPLVMLRVGLAAPVFALVIAGAAVISTGDARFSPYNRIDVTLTEKVGDLGAGEGEYRTDVNRDYHQFILDLSDDSLAREPSEARRFVRGTYDLPFQVSEQKGSALVVGAGTGNDVAAALRNGFQHVVSVDIDPEIIELGKALHPERPYSHPGVEFVVNDARAFFEQESGRRFDVVCYGLLDSHAMFSAMGTLRLDNYVYTLEGLRAGWQHVAPGGLMSVSFSVFAGEWMTSRLYETIKEATGRTPVVVQHGYNFGATFLVSDTLTPEALGFPAYESIPHIRIPTDDWPFLYIRPGVFPWVYLSVVLLIALSGVVLIRLTFGREALRVGSFDMELFALGAGFMLLQTRAITELSLLFGSTWVVNSSVFTGILIMVLAANTLVERIRVRNVQAWYPLLIASLVLVWMFSAGSLNQLTLAPRTLLAGLLYATPVFFAGVIFSSRLKASPHVSSALASNLCGAVLGGLLEYLSTLLGMRALGLLGICIYLMAALFGARKAQSGALPQRT